MRQENILRIFKALILLTLSLVGDRSIPENNVTARACLFASLLFFSVILFGFDKPDVEVRAISFFNDKRPPDDDQDKNLTLEV